MAVLSCCFGVLFGIQISRRAEILAYVAKGHTELCSYMCIWLFNVDTNLKVLYGHFCYLVGS